jgi:hypothetical protein
LDWAVRLDALRSRILDSVPAAERERLNSAARMEGPALREAGVRAAAQRAHLEGRLRQNPAAAKVLASAFRTISRTGSDAKARSAAVQELARNCDTGDLTDLAQGLLVGALTSLLRETGPEPFLALLDTAKSAILPNRRELLAPVEIAARHLRNGPEDERILDQQTPEMRSTVEMILNEVRKSASQAGAPK